MIYISKEKKFQKFVEGGIRGAKPVNFRYLFDHVLPARLGTDFDATSGIR